MVTGAAKATARGGGARWRATRRRTSGVWRGRRGVGAAGAHGEGAGVADRDRGRRRRAGDEADVGDLGVLPRASRKKTSLRRRSAASRHAPVDEEVDDDEAQLTDTEVGLGDGRRRPN